MKVRRFQNSLTSFKINMINIFTDDKTDPVIKFYDNDISVKKCNVNGQVRVKSEA